MANAFNAGFRRALPRSRPAPFESSDPATRCGYLSADYSVGRLQRGPGRVRSWSAGSRSRRSGLRGSGHASRHRGQPARFRLRCVRRGREPHRRAHIDIGAGHRCWASVLGTGAGHRYSAPVLGIGARHRGADHRSPHRGSCRRDSRRCLSTRLPNGGGVSDPVITDAVTRRPRRRLKPANARSREPGCAATRTRPGRPSPRCAACRPRGRCSRRALGRQTGASLPDR